MTRLFLHQLKVKHRKANKAINKGKEEEMKKLLIASLVIVLALAGFGCGGSGDGGGGGVRRVPHFHGVAGVRVLQQENMRPSRCLVRAFTFWEVSAQI